jgi:GH15 family glucan-1,4-alpha-glucosidase
VTARSSLDLAVIGNCDVAALIDRTGVLVWACWPRFDGDPVFCALVDGDEPKSGYFSITVYEPGSVEQDYLRNTEIGRAHV